jgi:protease PrsW
VLITFVTRNANLVPTIILLGSFLVPVAFVTYAFGHADRVVIVQRIFTAFVYGGVLGASVLEAAFLRQPSGPAYLGVGLIEEAVKLAGRAVAARPPPAPLHHARRDRAGAAVGFGFAAFESAGYAFNALFTSTGPSLMTLVESEALRGILAPVGSQGIAVWLTLLLTGTPVRWLLIQPGRAPEVTPAQAHLFTILSWGLSALDALLGVLVLRGRWRRATASDRLPPPTPFPLVTAGGGQV